MPVLRALLVGRLERYVLVVLFNDASNTALDKFTAVLDSVRLHTSLRAFTRFVYVDASRFPDILHDASVSRIPTFGIYVNQKWTNKRKRSSQLFKRAAALVKAIERAHDATKSKTMTTSTSTSR